MSSQDDLIKLQSKNLFDVPLDMEVSLDEPMQKVNLDMSKIEIGGGISPFKLEQAKQVSIEHQTDLSDLEEMEISDFGEVEPVKFGGDSQMFDSIELSHNIPEQQTGGGVIENLENVEISEITDNNIDEIEELGNNINIGEDYVNQDDSMFDEQDSEQITEPKQWINPELSIEDDNEMVAKLNQEEIDMKVAMYIDYYNSEEYNQYLKYYQIIYSASPYKYGIRRDNDGNIYLVKRQKNPAGKKIKESVSEMLDRKPPKSYLIKLTPPMYMNIQEELNKINNDLSILSGEIKIIQKDLIEIGVDISKDDIKNFEKIRDKFYKLMNRKYIYNKYYLDINNILINEEQKNIYLNESVSYIDKNDNKLYKLLSHIITVDGDKIDNMTIQLKENLEKYMTIINQENNNENNKEYKKSIKDFLVNKKNTNDFNKKELNGLINLSKERVNFIIKKLPKIDIKEEPI
jgi:hypothetical protein